MRYLKYLMFVVMVGALQACGTYQLDKTYNPSESQLKKLDHMQQVGETTVEVDYRTYLYFIRTIDKVNGVAYDRTNKRHAVLKGLRGARRPLYHKVLGKVLAENPGATYFRVVREERVTDRLFLGSISKLKLTVRAYKSK